MLLFVAILAADFSGTWVGTVNGGPMCLALSQNTADLTGHLAYENDRKYAELSSGKVNGEQLDFEVADTDHGTIRFRFHAEGEKLIGDDGAVLTKWVPRRNRQFDVGKPVPPSIIRSVSPNTNSKETGAVKLSILILTNGDVDPRSIKVGSSAGKALDEAAIQAVVQWKLTPPREDCNFYEKRVPVEFNFR
jgi:TonB family protein